LQIIPVIDLMAGQVVRGIAGRRNEYRPIESPLVCDAKPVSLGRAFAALGLKRSYIADLDAIGGADPAWSTYEELAAVGLELWIDAGTGCTQRATAMQRFAASTSAVSGIVIGLESLSNPGALADVASVVGPRLAVFSLDLKAGRPLAGEAWGQMPAEEIVALAVDGGIERAIVLDLAQVGRAQGVGTVELCRRLAAQFPRLELIAGGGVRGPADLEQLSAAGCSSAMVATALHDGSLAPVLKAGRAG
jgi:phosphoribosylformimino-5-aminoimidazole carboxamide ribotide isomerase